MRNPSSAESPGTSTGRAGNPTWGIRRNAKQVDSRDDRPEEYGGDDESLHPAHPQAGVVLGEKKNERDEVDQSGDDGVHTEAIPPRVAEHREAEEDEREPGTRECKERRDGVHGDVDVFRGEADPDRTNAGDRQRAEPDPPGFAGPEGRPNQEGRQNEKDSHDDDPGIEHVGPRGARV